MRVHRLDFDKLNVTFSDLGGDKGMLANVATLLFMLLVFCLPDSGLGEEGYPYILRSAKVPGLVRDLAVTQSRPNLIFAAVLPPPKSEEKGGLYIFEISSGGELREVSSYPIESPTALAITPDGKTLFVQNTLLPGSADQIKYFGIIALDITVPERPTLLGTLEVKASTMHLSWDGQLLFVQQGPLPESKGIQIYDVADPRKAILQAVIPTKAPAYGMLLTKSHRLAVQDTSDMLSIFDVTDVSHPRLLTERRSDRFRSVLLEPSPSMLYASGIDGFKVLATEHSIREVGAYTETVPYGVPYISSNGRRMIFASRGPYTTAGPHIAILDISDAVRPKTAMRFPVPTYPGRVVLAEKLGFIVAGLVGAVAIIDENRLVPTVEDLATVHEKALAVYTRADSDERRSSAPREALRMLEEGGIQQAIHRKPDGLSARRYAQILNDYAFLELQIGPTNKEATMVLRKVISIDPSRSVAFLNLGQALQAQLRLLRTFDEKLQSTTEIKKLYSKYIKLTGKTVTQIANFMALNLVDRPINNPCAYVAAYVNADRVEELLSTSTDVDLNNDGTVDKVSLADRGTAHEMSLELYDKETGDPIAIHEVDKDFNGSWAANIGIVPFKDGYYLIHYDDRRYPVVVTMIKGNNNEYVRCRFRVEVKEAVGKDSKERELCEVVLDERHPPYLPFKKPDERETDLFYEKWQLTNTYLEGLGSVDMDNDGIEEPLVRLLFSSGAGSGCGYVYFDLLNIEGTELKDKEKRRRLLGMQVVSPGEWQGMPRCGGNTTGWFRFKGRTYYETKFDGEHPRSSRDEFHEVKYIQGREIHSACHFDIKTTVK